MKLQLQEKWQEPKTMYYLADHIAQYYGFPDESIEVTQEQYDHIKHYYRDNQPVLDILAQGLVMGRSLIIYTDAAT